MTTSDEQVCPECDRGLVDVLYSEGFGSFSGSMERSADIAGDVSHKEICERCHGTGTLVEEDPM